MCSLLRHTSQFLTYDEWAELTNLLIVKSLNNQGNTGHITQPVFGYVFSRMYASINYFIVLPGTRTSCERVANALHGPAVYGRSMELLDKSSELAAKFSKGNKKVG